MTNANPVVTPALTRHDDDEDDCEASTEEHRILRRVVGKTSLSPRTVWRGPRQNLQRQICSRSTSAIGVWQAEEVCNAFVIWMSALCGCRQKLLPNVFESARYQGPRTLPTQTPNLQTDVRSSSVVRVCELHRSRNSVVVQSRDRFDCVQCLCATHAPRAT